MENKCVKCSEELSSPSFLENICGCELAKICVLIDQLEELIKIFKDLLKEQKKITHHTINYYDKIRFVSDKYEAKLNNLKKNKNILLENKKTGEKVSGTIDILSLEKK